MTRAELLRFIAGHKWAVQASVAANGAPQAAVIGFAVTNDLELVFDTLETSRKAPNLRRDGRIALVIGWDDAQTVQCEGVADEPAGAALEPYRRCYMERFPDSLARQGWPGCSTSVSVSPGRDTATSARTTGRSSNSRPPS